MFKDRQNLGNIRHARPTAVSTRELESYFSSDMLDLFRSRDTAVLVSGWSWEGLTDLKNVRRGKYVSNTARDSCLVTAIVFNLCWSDELLGSVFEG